MAKAPVTANATPEATPAPEPVKVVVKETKPEEPKLSAQTLAEQAAGREALAALAARK